MKTEGAKKAKLRVAILSRNFHPAAGGAERYAFEIAKQLAHTCEIHIFTQNRWVTELPLHIHTMRWKVKYPSWLNSLLYALESYQATHKGFDIIHAHEYTWFGQIHTSHVRSVRYNLFCRPQSLVKKIWNQVRLVFSPRLWVYLGLEQARYRPLINRHIVCVSNINLQELQQAFPVWQDLAHRPRLHCLPPGVNLKHTQTFHTNNDLHTQLNLASDAKLLLMVCNDWQRKGVTCAFKALARLRQDHRIDVHLVIAGHSRQESIFVNYAVSLNIESAVHRLGKVEQIELLYHACDMLLHPTLEDSFAMVVAEAMACHLPVIVSKAPYCGLSEALTHNKHALLLDDPQDDLQLSQYCLQLLQNQHLAQTLQHHAFEFVQDYNWENIAAQYLTIYQMASQYQDKH